MSQNAKNSRPSFSAAARWGIGLDVLVRTALVLAVAVMVNFLAAKFSHRFYLGPETRTELSSRSLAVLRGLTNRVEVTLYYDRTADFYSDILALLNAYQAANKNISIRTVDYVADAGAAEKVKEKYNLPGAAGSPNAPPAKDLIIFDGGGRPIIVPGDSIVQYTLEQTLPDDPKQKELEFRKKPVKFNGELLFTAKLLALANARPPKAYFLQGHGETSLADTGNHGFSKFGTALAQSYIDVQNLEFSADDPGPIPADCGLLIIAGPVSPYSPAQLQRIDKYLAEGGRLLALFNYASSERPTGLEPILQRWGVNVMPDFVKDRNNKTDDIVVRKFGQHAAVNALAQFALQMIRPRCVAKVDWQNPPANAPQVDELAFSSDNSILVGDPSAPPRSYPLITAVEQKPAAGVAGPRGIARIIVTGDSIFLGNYCIDAGGNRDFVGYAANWLLDRPQLLEGVNPRPVTEYRLLLTEPQQRRLRWLLLGALPGGALLLGWLVWLVRRQ